MRVVFLNTNIKVVPISTRTPRAKKGREKNIWIKMAEQAFKRKYPFS